MSCNVGSQLSSSSLPSIISSLKSKSISSKTSTKIYTASEYVRLYWTTDINTNYWYYNINSSASASSYTFAARQANGGQTITDGSGNYHTLLSLIVEREMSSFTCDSSNFLFSMILKPTEYLSAYYNVDTGTPVTLYYEVTTL